MKVDMVKLYKPRDRNSILVSLNLELVTENGFLPNSFVNVIYDKGKIEIIDENEMINRLQKNKIDDNKEK